MRIFLMRSLFYGVRTVTVEIPKDYDGSLSIETSNAKNRLFRSERSYENQTEDIQCENQRSKPCLC